MKCTRNTTRSSESESPWTTIEAGCLVVLHSNIIPGCQGIIMLFFKNTCGLFGSDSECPFCDIRNGTCVQRDILKTCGCFDASWGDTSPSDRDTGQLAGDTVDRGQLAGDTLKTRAAALLHSSGVVLGHRRTGGYKWYESAKPDGLAGDVNMRGKKQVKIFREC